MVDHRLCAADNCNLAELEAHLFPEPAPIAPLATSPAPPPATPQLYSNGQMLSQQLSHGSASNISAAGGVTRDVFSGERSFEQPQFGAAGVPNPLVCHSILIDSSRCEVAWSSASFTHALER